MTAKGKILAAAAQVVDQSGAAHLTIDAVAAEAQLSKGGVLYHFPTKRAILEGMLAHLIERLQERIDGHLEVLDDGPNPLARAFVLAEAAMGQDERAMSQALLAAAAEDPSLLDPARAAIRSWFLRASAEGEQGIVVLLAIEGLRFLDILGLLPGELKRDAVHASLLQLAEGGAK